MSEYQAMRVEQAIRAETARISDYVATGHRLRAAALSDLRHPSATGMLDILLPDVPGVPFGGTATTVQREAVSQATGSYVPARLFPGKDTRPHDLRALLRAWAASQTQPRWEIRPYNTPNEHVWVILRDSQAVAEVYDRQDAEFVLAALQARPDPATGEPDLLQESITRARRDR